jgi:hypothetical protein
VGQLTVTNRRPARGLRSWSKRASTPFARAAFAANQHRRVRAGGLGQRVDRLLHFARSRFGEHARLRVGQHSLEFRHARFERRPLTISVEDESNLRWLEGLR